MAAALNAIIGMKKDTMFVWHFYLEIILDNHDDCNQWIIYFSTTLVTSLSTIISKTTASVAKQKQFPPLENEVSNEMAWESSERH